MRVSADYTYCVKRKESMYYLAPYVSLVLCLFLMLCVKYGSKIYSLKLYVSFFSIYHGEFIFEKLWLCFKKMK